MIHPIRNLHLRLFQSVTRLENRKQANRAVHNDKNKQQPTNAASSGKRALNKTGIF
jgi:hypothetical protein